MHDYLYCEFHEGGAGRPQGDWKAVRLARSGPAELYDLQTDLGETNNVAASQEMVSRGERLFETTLHAQCDGLSTPIELSLLGKPPRGRVLLRGEEVGKRVHAPQHENLHRVVRAERAEIAYVGLIGFSVSAT